MNIPSLYQTKFVVGAFSGGCFCAFTLERKCTEGEMAEKWEPSRSQKESMLNNYAQRTSNIFLQISCKDVNPELLMNRIARQYILERFKKLRIPLDRADPSSGIYFQNARRNKTDG